MAITTDCGGGHSGSSGDGGGGALRTARVRIGIFSGGERKRGFGLGRGRRRGAFGLAAAAADGDVAEDAALGPVAAAVLAEVAGLGEVVVVVIAEFGVERIAPGAFQGGGLVVAVWPQSPVTEHPTAGAAGSATDGVYVLHLDEVLW